MDNSATTLELPQEALERLALLRDLQMPEPVASWPLAPGWWLMALTLVVTLAVGLWWRARRAGSARGVALRELDEIARHYRRTGAARMAAISVSTLLRRYALVTFGRQHAAGLVGSRWLGFLNSVTAQPLFEGDTGRLLLTAPYRPDPETPDDKRANEIDTLITAARNWLRAAQQER